MTEYVTTPSISNYVVADSTVQSKLPSCESFSDLKSIDDVRACLHPKCYHLGSNERLLWSLIQLSLQDNNTRQLFVYMFTV